MSDLDIIRRDDDGFDADATWTAAEDAVYAEDPAVRQTPAEVAQHLIGALSDDELDALHDAARMDEGGLDPRRPGARLRMALSSEDSLRNWTPRFDGEDVMALVNDHDAARAVIAEFVADIEAVYGRGPGQLAPLAADWPDLLATYERAVVALKARP